MMSRLFGFVAFLSLSLSVTYADFYDEYDPTDPEEDHKSAGIYFDGEGDFEMAVTAFSAACEFENENPSHYTNLSVALMRYAASVSHDEDQMEELFSRSKATLEYAAKMNEDNPAITTQYQELRYVVEDNMNMDVEDLIESDEPIPGYIPHVGSRAIDMENLGSGSSSDYNQMDASDYDPNDPYENHTQMGINFDKAKNNEMCLIAFKAAARWKGLPSDYSNLGVALLRAGNNSPPGSWNTERYYGQAKWALNKANDLAGGYDAGAMANLKDLAQAVDTQLSIELDELEEVPIEDIEEDLVNPNKQGSFGNSSQSTMVTEAVVLSWSAEKVSEWLMSSSSLKIPDDMKKEYASQIRSKGVDGRKFEAMVSDSTKVKEIGVTKAIHRAKLVVAWRKVKKQEGEHSYDPNKAKEESSSSSSSGDSGASGASACLSWSPKEVSNFIKNNVKLPESAMEEYTRLVVDKEVDGKEFDGMISNREAVKKIGVTKAIHRAKLVVAWKKAKKNAPASSSSSSSTSTSGSSDSGAKSWSTAKLVEWMEGLKIPDSSKSQYVEKVKSNSVTGSQFDELVRSTNRLKAKVGVTKAIHRAKMLVAWKKVV